MLEQKASTLDKRVPLLENRLSAVEDELRNTTQCLDERSTALSQARKYLKAARTRNTVR